MQIAAHEIETPTTPAAGPRLASFSRPGLLALADGMVLTVSSGSMPSAFRPGVSRIDRPLLRSGWG